MIRPFTLIALLTAAYAGAAGAQTAAPALPRAAAEALRQAIDLPNLHGFSALPDPHPSAALPNGVATTAVERRFGGLTTAAGFLCGRHAGVDNNGAAVASGYDPTGRFVGAKLSLAFR